MTWFALSANQTAAEAEHVQMLIAVDFDFPSGHARFWTGYGEITIGGNVYTGAGALGRVSFPNERAGLDASRKTFQLAGAEISPSLVSEADIDACFGREVTEYLGFLNPATGRLVDEPEVNWEGQIDSVRRRDGYEPSIEVNAEHRLVRLEQASGWRWTHEHQQKFYAGDTGFQLVAASLLREIVWGGIIVGGGASGGSLVGGGGRFGNFRNLNQ